jgi:hypothetical protein
MVIPAGFEPTACRLGGDRSILLSYGTSFSKVLILQGFRGFGDCSPWCLGVVFANQEGRFLIGFSNFGGRTFFHLLILTLRNRGVGLIPFPGHFRTLRPFSASGKAVVGLFLRRRVLYPLSYGSKGKTHCSTGLFNPQYRKKLHSRYTARILSKIFSEIFCKIPLFPVDS